MILSSFNLKVPIRTINKCKSHLFSGLASVKTGIVFSESPILTEKPLRTAILYANKIENSLFICNDSFRLSDH